jgi:hypothetical protein
VAFNDLLEYEIDSRQAGGQRRIWIEDDYGLRVLSEDTCLDC